MKAQCLLAASILAAMHPASGALRFFPLGDLPGGNYQSTAAGVSADGKVVVGSSESSVGNEAFRWSMATGMKTLSGLPQNSYAASATAISDNGNVIAGILAAASGSEAFRWTATGVLIVPKLPGGTTAPYVTGMSANGTVLVGQASSSNGAQPFRWTAAAGTQGLGDLKTGSSSEGTAWSVSADGSVIVGYVRSDAAGDGWEAFTWTSPSGLKGLGDLSGGAFQSAAFGISPDATVMVGSGIGSSGTEAVRWPAGALIQSIANGASSTAEDASIRGEIIVGGGYPAADPEALIWDADGMQTIKQWALARGLNLGSWALTYASEVSPNGRHIVGTGKNPSGQTEGWLLSVLPDPPTIALTGKPKVRAKSNGKFKVRGTADDDAAVTRVEYQIGGKGRWLKARGTNKWRISAKVKDPGRPTKISIRSIDEDGQTSNTTKTKILSAT